MWIQQVENFFLKKMIEAGSLIVYITFGYTRNSFSILPRLFFLISSTMGQCNETFFNVVCLIKRIIPDNTFVLL